MWRSLVLAAVAPCSCAGLASAQIDERSVAIKEYAAFPTNARMRGEWCFRFYGETLALPAARAADLGKTCFEVAGRSEGEARIQYGQMAKKYTQLAEAGGREPEPLEVEDHELSISDDVIYHKILLRGGYTEGGSTWQRLATDEFCVYRDVNTRAADAFLVYPPQSHYVRDVILFQLWNQAAATINYCANFGRSSAPGKWLVDQSVFEEHGIPTGFAILARTDHMACSLEAGEEDNIHAQVTMLDVEGRPVRQSNSTWASERLVALEVLTWHPSSHELDDKQGVRVLSFRPETEEQADFAHIAMEPVLATTAVDLRRGDDVRFDPLQGVPALTDGDHTRPGASGRADAGGEEHSHVGHGPTRHRASGGVPAEPADGTERPIERSRRSADGDVASPLSAAAEEDSSEGNDLLSLLGWFLAAVFGVAMWRARR